MIPLSLAVIVVVPVLPAVARPELLIVATFVEDEDQVTDDVTSLLELSPKVPVAVNCCVLLLSVRVELLGDIEIATSVLADGKNWPHAVPNTTAAISSPKPITLKRLLHTPEVGNDGSPNSFIMRRRSPPEI